MPVLPQLNFAPDPCSYIQYMLRKEKPRVSRTLAQKPKSVYDNRRTEGFNNLVREPKISVMQRRRRVMLEVGTPAPDFSIAAHDGSTVTLSELRGKKVVLWFYPKANTGG